MAIMTLLDGAFSAIAGAISKIVAVIVSMMISAGSLATAPATDDLIKAADAEAKVLVFKRVSLAD